MDQPPRPETGPPAGRQPVLRVVRGHPTDQELAALVSVLFGRAESITGPGPAPGPRSGTRRPAW